MTVGLTTTWSTASSLGSATTIASKPKGLLSAPDTTTWIPKLTVRLPEHPSLCTYSGTVTVSVF